MLPERGRRTSEGPSRTDVVIVGGGFSGAAAAYHLLQRAHAGLRVTLVERGPTLGRGVAYGVEGSQYLLNVPALRMSLDPALPDDLVSFAGPGVDPLGFLPRALYGAYVERRLRQAAERSAGELQVVRGEAIDIDPAGVRLSDGRVLPAHHVVLATGVTPNSTTSLPSDPRIIDGWNERHVAELPLGGTVLVLGSGLTALDVVSVLHQRGFSGSLTLLSRHGWLPYPHTSTSMTALPAAALLRRPTTARGLSHWLRAVIAEVEQLGGAWQHGVDAVRPHLPAVWRALSATERRRFLRHLRSRWEPLRHRAPPAVLAHVEALRHSHQLEVVAGTLSTCVVGSQGVDVELRLRGGGLRQAKYQALVRCLGPALGFDEARMPLLASLLQRGLAQRDPTGLGVVTDEAGAIVPAAGAPPTELYALGALRRASAWETTAVPEIVAQAQALAERLTRR